MKKRTWKVTGGGPDTWIMECCPTERNEDELVTYDEARAHAWQILEDYVSLALNRIEDLKQGKVQTQRETPTLNVWRSYRHLFAASTKKRAVELSGETPQGFGRSFNEVTPAHGDWWYPYAEEESAWYVVRDESGDPTGEYKRLILLDEATAFLNEVLAEYDTFSKGSLLSMVDQEQIVERVSTRGLRTQVVVNVSQPDEKPSVFNISGHIKRRVQHYCGVFIQREFPTEPACNWKAEGF